MELTGPGLELSEIASLRHQMRRAFSQGDLDFTFSAAHDGKTPLPNPELRDQLTTHLRNTWAQGEMIWFGPVAMDVFADADIATLTQEAMTQVDLPDNGIVVFSRKFTQGVSDNIVFSGFSWLTVSENQGVVYGYSAAGDMPDSFPPQVVPWVPFTSVTGSVKDALYAIFLRVVLTVHLCQTTLQPLPARHHRKLKGRSDRPRPSRDVVVVDMLRTPSPAPQQRGSGDPIEHDHRWPVRRHKRLQPYGPGRRYTKEIWIEEFLKGPADAPIVRTERVFKLDPHKVEE